MPVEVTLPNVALSLFRPDDSNVWLFNANGFEVDNNEGFGWFYPKDGTPQLRAMVTRIVEERE